MTGWHMEVVLEGDDEDNRLLAHTWNCRVINKRTPFFLHLLSCTNRYLTLFFAAFHLS